MFEGLMRPWHADTYYVRPRWRDVAEGTPRSEVAQVRVVAVFVSDVENKIAMFGYFVGLP